jgi:signal transduction histidine kinase
MTQDYKSQIRNRNITISFHGSKELDSLEVFADEERIKQVVSNLLDNAIKFTEGTIFVNVETTPENDQVLVNIKDTGRGIDSDILPKLFTKFVTKSERGTGLGLYICKGIIEAHGRRIWAKNYSVEEEDLTVTSSDATNISGAIFSFSLPLGNFWL